MAANNDDILSIILAERGETNAHVDSGSVASDAGTAEAYRELSAIARLAHAARPSEHAWRDQAVSSTMDALHARPASDFRHVPARRTALRGLIAAAAAIICVAGAAMFYDAQPDSPVHAPVAFSPHAPQQAVSEANGVYRVAVAGQHDAVPAGFGEYRSLADSIESAAAGSTLQIQASDSAEMLRLSKPLKVFAVGGTVRIGARQ